MWMFGVSVKRLFYRKDGRNINKSVAYIKDRIKNTPDQVGDIPLSGWEKAIVINPIKQYLSLLPDLQSCFISDNEFKINLSCDKGQIDIIIKYDTDIEFDYFSSTVTTHDGTMLFIMQSIEELLYKLFKLETYAKNKITSDFIENPSNYDVKYTIGDIVMHSDYGMKSINGNEMDGETDTIVLPIKFEATKKLK